MKRVIVAAVQRTPNAFGVEVNRCYLNIKRKNNQMKRNLLTLVAAGAIACGGFALAQVIAREAPGTVTVRTAIRSIG